MFERRKWRGEVLLAMHQTVMELDWRGLAAAFKSTPADVILGGAPGVLDIQLSV